MSASPASETEQARARLWSAWTALEPRQRAILVLGIQDELTDEEVARTLGSTLKRVRSHGTDGYVALRRTTQLDVQSLSRELRAAFARNAADLRPDLELVVDARDRAAQLSRQRRLRVGSAVAAVAVVAAVAIGASALFGDDPPASGSPAPTDSPTPSPSSSQPGSSPAPSVAAIPDAVLALARDTGALIAWGPAIVDGTGDSAAVVVEIDPANGASLGEPILGLARAQGGYVVSSRTQAALGASSQRLSYVGRDGSRTELGRVTDQQGGFAVAADGYSVVHVIAGPVLGENPLAAGESELVVQALSGDVINRVVVPGPVRPIALDEDRVWFVGMDEFVNGGAYVWERDTGRVTQVPVGRRSYAEAARGNQLLLDQVRGESFCIRSLDVTDVEAPTEQWRRCGVGYPIFDPTATRIATVSLDTGAVIHLLDPRDGAVLDTIDLDADFADQFAWTAGGTSLVVEAFTEGGVITYVEVVTSGPDGGGVLTRQTFEVPEGPIVLGTELMLPSVR